MKILRVIVPILVIILIAGLVLLFWDPIMDLLPVDQSGWEARDSVTRYLDEDGDPLTGWQNIENKRYYFDPATGAMVTGWLELDGSRYFLSETDGSLVTGWLNLSMNPYYMGADGVMATGWTDIDGKRYLFDANGICLTGWQEVNGSTYFLGADGAMATGWLDTDEGRCFLDANGSKYSGWLTTEEGTFYLGENGIVSTGWQEIDGKRYYLGEDGILVTGWQDIDGQRYYLSWDGAAAAGWQDIDGQRYYMDQDGAVYTGWLELGGNKYYLKEDGSMAVGKLVIEDETYYFASNGANILLVNRWNTLPDDYVPAGLVTSEYGAEMLPDAAAALDKMIEDCKAAGYKPMVRTSYRTFGYQKALLDKKIAEVGSYDKAIQIVAIPGTSEHHTGLAVDVSDSTYTYLNREQGNQPIQQWLREHCWEYGFIVRYPDGTTDITGIIYESWHFRYVGVELAKEITESGLCLEAYLDALTNDGTTCGDPASLENE